MKKVILRASLLVLILALLGCGPPTISLEQTQENRDIPKSGEVPLTINNCGGARHEETISKKTIINMSGEASLGVDYQMVEGKLLARYGVEQQHEVTYKIEIEENKKYEIEVTWVEDEFQGFITTDQRSGKASYAIRIPKHVSANITSFDCRYEHFIQSIEPPIRDERVLEAIRMGIQYDDWPLARQLMAEAGYPDGIKVTFLLSRFDELGSSIESAEIDILVKYLGEIGVWVTPIPKE